MSRLRTHVQKKMKSGVGRSPSGRARSTRFPQEAADVMLRYYHNVSTFPGETERIELAREVRSVAPRCSHYTAHHVYQYFANLRHRAKNGIEPSLPSDGYVLSTATPTVSSTALDGSMPEEPRRSAEAESPSKERRATSSPAASMATEGAGSDERETATHSAESSRPPPSPPSDRTGKPTPPSPSSFSHSNSESTSTVQLQPQGQDNTPESELPTHPFLATQLRFVLARYNATRTRHRFRPNDSESPPKSFVELATWLSERRPAVAPL